LGYKTKLPAEISFINIRSKKWVTPSVVLEWVVRMLVTEVAQLFISGDAIIRLIVFVVLL